MKKIILPLLVFFIFAGLTAPRLRHEKISREDTALSATDSILHFWLKKESVNDHNPVFKTLFFFVPVHELDSVEKDHQLLRNFNFENEYQSGYFNTLSESRFDKSAIASVLRESNRLWLRDAWPCYWALISESQYGQQLIKAELEDSSLFVGFYPEEKIPFVVYDIYGNVLSQSQFIRRKDQVAAVFMVEKIPGSPEYYHRSFILTNEKMIREWQHDTPVLQQEMLTELNYLLLAQAWVKAENSHTAKPGKAGKKIRAAWMDNSQRKSLPAKFYSCYRRTEPFNMDAAMLESAIAALRKIFPDQVKTMDKFPSRGIR